MVKLVVRSRGVVRIFLVGRSHSVKVRDHDHCSHQIVMSTSTVFTTSWCRLFAKEGLQKGRVHRHSRTQDHPPPPLVHQATHYRDRAWKLPTSPLIIFCSGLVKFVDNSFGRSPELFRLQVHFHVNILNRVIFI